MSHHSITVGIDVGDCYSHLCLLDNHSGEVIEEGRISTNPTATRTWAGEGRPRRP